MYARTIYETPCDHWVTDEGVHLMVMHESSRHAVDIWLQHMSDVMHYLCAHQDAYAPVLLDLREPGMMPVGYATYAVRMWAEQNPRPPKVDLALVYRYGLLYKLADAFTHLTRIEDGVQLFHKGRYDPALTWLSTRATPYRLIHS